MSDVDNLREPSDEVIAELLEVYKVPMVGEIAMVLWGYHEVAAKPSHRPEAVRELFCDANASMVLAAAVYKRVVAPALAAGQPEAGPAVDDRPHSRACGWHKHDHGFSCSTNCPTCHGQPEAGPE